MKKFISFAMILALLGGPALQSCTNMTPQQKKTKKFQRKQRSGSMPCPLKDC